MAPFASLRFRGLHLEAFQAPDAPLVAAWVNDAQTLDWVAPSTTGPLTAEKVLEWKKPSGKAWLLHTRSTDEPIGYGELNPLEGAAGHFWLGHVLMHPGFRRRGLGSAFVKLLVQEAARRGGETVSLIVFPQNVAAIRCYARAGFECAGEESHRFRGGPPQRLLRYELSLAESSSSTSGTSRRRTMTASPLAE